MPESFGARLRQRRQDQHIALATIADETKIKLSLLEALERDDVSHWPSGIFRRAYIRAYAHAIGLSPNDVVREFLEAHPEPPEILTADPALTPASDDARAAGGPPSRLRYLVGSALGSLSRLRRGPAAEASAAPSATPPVEPAVDIELPTPASAPAPVPVTRAGSAPAMDPEQEDRLTAIAVEAGGDEFSSPAPDFLVLARLCTRLGRVASVDEMPPLLSEAARLLDATGLIVWLWDPSAAVLRPVLAHGYSDKVLAQLPVVRREADNATAAAFRSARPCAVSGRDLAPGALVVPLLAPEGCAGVLALEMQHGGERRRLVRAAATILAALLAQLTGGGAPAEARHHGHAAPARAAGGTTNLPERTR